MSEKMTDVLARLQRDVAFREEFTKDPWAILTGVGIQRPATGSIEVSLVGTGEQTDIAFIGTGDESSVLSSDVDSTGNPNWCWPYRYYKLYNRCDHDLNLEVWAHPGGGIQQHAIRVNAGTDGWFRVAIAGEVVENRCNLSDTSHLVRDLVDSKVLEESWTVTCGKFWNVWEVTGSGGTYKLVESHPLSGCISGSKNE